MYYQIDGAGHRPTKGQAAWLNLFNTELSPQKYRWELRSQEIGKRETIPKTTLSPL